MEILFQFLHLNNIFLLIYEILYKKYVFIFYP